MPKRLSYDDMVGRKTDKKGDAIKESSQAALKDINKRRPGAVEKDQVKKQNPTRAQNKAKRKINY